MLTLPATEFGIIFGTKNGLTRVGPFSMIVVCVFSIVSRPPMPVPRIAPARSGSCLPSPRPASSHAICAAARP